jgi:hypothetical protein
LCDAVRSVLEAEPAVSTVLGEGSEAMLQVMLVRAGDRRVHGCSIAPTLHDRDKVLGAIIIGGDCDRDARLVPEL